MLLFSMDMIGIDNHGVENYLRKGCTVLSGPR